MTFTVPLPTHAASLLVAFLTLSAQGPGHLEVAPPPARVEQPAPPVRVQPTPWQAQRRTDQ